MLGVCARARATAARVMWRAQSPEACTALTCHKFRFGHALRLPTAEQCDANPAPASSLNTPTSAEHQHFNLFTFHLRSVSRSVPPHLVLLYRHQQVIPGQTQASRTKPLRSVLRGETHTVAEGKHTARAASAVSHTAETRFTDGIKPLLTNTHRDLTSLHT